MAGQNVLTAIIGADGSQFTKTLGQLERQLKSFEAGLKSAGSVESFNRLNRAIDATKQRISALKNIQNPLRPIQGGADGATASLINLGRVVQDAPFGFLGIANNLNPLVEGFARTTKSAGGFGAAMKQVGSSLLGAGGLSLGISLISSGLILFGDKLFGASKATKALDESIKQSAESVSKEAASLTTIVGLILNSNTAQEDRVKALKAVNEQYGPLLKNMDIEKVTLGNIKDAYDKVIDSLLRQAVVKGIQDQISASVEKTAKTILTMETAEENRRIASEKSAKSRKTQAQTEKDLVKEFAQQQQQFTSAARDGNLALASQQRELTQTFQSENTYEKALQRVKDALKEQLSPLLNLTTKFEDLGIKLKETKDKTFDFIQQAQRMAAFLDKNTQFSVSFEVDPSLSEAENTAKAKEFLAKAKAFFEEQSSRLGVFSFKTLVRFDPKFIADPKFFRDIQEQAGIEATKTYKEIKKEFEDNIKQLVANSPINIDPKFNIKESTRDQVLKLGGSVRINPQFAPDFADGVFETSIDKATKFLNDKLIDVVGSFEQNIAGALGQGIGEAISGGGFASLFKGVFNAVGGALQQLGEALIATAVGLKAIKAAFKTLNPVVALAAGVGLIALGAVIKNTIGNISGFRAAGGPVHAGGSFIVGEKGPELFVPNTGGNIIPNNRLSGSVSPVSAQPVFIMGEFRQRGNDLVAVISSTQRQQGRLG